jgi:hypothetical protein
MPELIPPTARLHAAWLEAHAEWGAGQHEDGFGLHPSDEVDSPAGFAAWLTRLASQPDPAKRAAGRRCLYRWIVEDDRALRRRPREHHRQQIRPGPPLLDRPVAVPRAGRTSPHVL